MIEDDIYKDGRYLIDNPTWHSEDSQWKAVKILALISELGISPHKIADFGCGAGGVLSGVVDGCPSSIGIGLDTSTHAIEIANKLHLNDKRLRFSVGDCFDDDSYFDLLMLVDVVEHIEDVFSFVRRFAGRSKFYIFHIPLELTAHNALPGTPFDLSRRSVGHLHYFSKVTALSFLRDCGFSVVAHRYTNWSGEIPVVGFWRRVVKFSRGCVFRVAPDFSVRAFGGASLLVVCKD